jgi:NADP-dependent 3-hydroxy acid dehydrogenase YdfG
MKTLLIVGTGPGIGTSLAPRFGREGYLIGLISRSQEKLNGYVSGPTSLSIESITFTADVQDLPALLAAIEKIRAHFGSIDILKYSPLIEMATLSVF